MTPVVRSRGYLPHVEAEGAIYFVTFRLADSLPRDLLAQLRKEREALKRAMRAGTEQAGDRIRREKIRSLLRKAERWLDRGLGRCYLRDPRIARVVADALWHFAGVRYRLRVWCVMPNHVHVVFSPLRGHALEAVVHSWKSFSALAANRLLGRSGAFGGVLAAGIFRSLDPA